MNAAEKEENSRCLREQYKVAVCMNTVESYTLGGNVIQEPLTIVTVKNINRVAPRGVTELVRLLRNTKNTTDWGFLAFELLESCRINQPNSLPIYKGWLNSHAPKV